MASLSLGCGLMDALESHKDLYIAILCVQIGAFDCVIARKRPYGSKGRQGRDFHYQKETPRVAMLSMRRLGSFKYDIREIMTHYDVDEALASSIVANVIAKSSRQSIEEAKEYVRDSMTKGEMIEPVGDEICNLLDRYSKWR